MPATSGGDAATWRSHPYHCRGYLWLLQPEVVFRAQVNLADAEYPLDEIPFDNVTIGADTDIRAGMTLVLGSAPGLWDLGMQRVKSATSTEIAVGRSSQGANVGELDVQDDVYIDVWDDFRVWAKIPRINSSGVQFKDGDIAVGDYGEEQTPVANGGTGYIGFVDEISGLITVAFPTGAIAMADGASIVTHLWEIGDGSYTVGNSASAAPTATFPAGKRWVHHTVTDSNGKTHERHIPVVGLERTGANSPVMAFEVERESWRIDGHSLSLRVLEDIPADTYPDGTLVMYFEEEYFGDGTKGSLTGPTGREHIKFIGWLHRNEDSIQRDREGLRRDTVVECLDVAGRLKVLPGFSQVIKKKGSPDEWQEMTEPDLEKYLHHLLQWHSTALDLADYQKSGAGHIYEFKVLGSDGDSLYSQVDKRAQAMAYRFACDKRGRLWVKCDPQLVNESSEPLLSWVTARTTTEIIALTEDDILDIQYAHEHHPRFHWHRGNAVMADPSRIWSSFVIAPGKAPGQGEQASEQGQQLAYSREELRAREGHRYARKNAPESFFDVTLAHSGDIDIDPAYMEWIRITLSPQYAAQRGLNWTDERFLVHEVEIAHRNERTGRTKEVRLRVEREVYGYPAEIDPIEEGGGNVTIYGTVNVSPYSTPVAVAPAGPGALQLYRGTKKIAAFNMDGYVYITTGFELSPPSWLRYDLGLATGTSTFELYDFVVDPFSPGYLGTGTEVNGWIAGGDGIYRIVDIFGARTVTLQKSLGGTLAHPVEGRVINCGWGFQNWVMCSSYRTDGVYVTYTTDGSTWSAEQRVGHNGWFTAGASPGLHVSSKVPGKAYLHTIIDGIATSKGYITTNYGATWAAITAGVNGPDMTSFHPSQIHIPYHSNDDEMIAYWSWLSGASEPFTLHLYRTEADGTTITEITPTTGSGEFRGRGSKWVVYTCPVDRLTVVAGIVDDSVVATATFGLVGSRDGGDTWFDIITPVTGSGSWIQGAALSGNDENILYVWGNAGHLWYSQNPGVTLEDKRGNIPTDYPSVDRFVAICGG